MKASYKIERHTQAQTAQAHYDVRPGDLWRLGGRHYLVCGDSSQPEPWETALEWVQTGLFDGIITSPPYAMQRARPGQYGGIPADQYVAWWEPIQDLARNCLAPHGSFFLNIKEHTIQNGPLQGQRHTYVMELVLSMVKLGWSWIDQFVWRHAGIPGLPRYKFKNQFEPIYHFAQAARAYKFRPKEVMQPSREAFNAAGGGAMSQAQGLGDELAHVKANGRKGYHKGMAYPGNVLSFGQNQDPIGHPAMFPVGLPRWFMLAYSDPGDSWMDSFSGAGTTFLAAEQTGRVAAGIERVPENVALTLWRFQERTGGQVELVKRGNNGQG